MAELESSDSALVRLRTQLTAGWETFPDAEGLDVLLQEALTRASDAEPQVITVTSPVSRPMRLRLARLGDPANLDSFYRGESAELCVSQQGCCYLVYRRSDGGEYAVEWSSATLVPEQLMRNLPDVLAAAMFDGQA